MILRNEAGDGDGGDGDGGDGGAGVGGPGGAGVGGPAPFMYLRALRISHGRITQAAIEQHLLLKVQPQVDPGIDAKRGGG